MGWEILNINNNYYAIVANFKNNSTYNVNSKLYSISINTGKLTPIQDYSTNGAFDFESFEIKGKQYVLVANYYNGSTRNINSKLYSISANKKCVISSTSLMERLLQWAVSQGFEME